jgi:hypothetical protein
MFKKILMAGIAALTMGGAVATTASPAQAQYYGYRPYAGPSGIYGSGGYYPGYGYGGYDRGYGYGYGYPYYRHRRSNGGAVAAGLIGGLALGTIAAQAARPAYGYRRAYYGRPAYYYPRNRSYRRARVYRQAYAGCWIRRQRIVNRFGAVVVRRVRVCG